MNEELCSASTKKKCDSFYKKAFMYRKKYIEQLQQENTQLKENNISRELIRKRIKEIYEEYLQEYPKRFENEYYLMSRYALKVLVDIYSFDDDEENRLIHHGWDIIESAIEFILEEELKGSENE